MEGGTDTFVFSGTPSGSIDTNNETIQANVTPGTTYTSTEAVLEGWDLTNIECNDDNSTGDVATRTATFRAEAGETVTCTFTNTRRGTIIIDKVTDPSGDATSFDFRLTGGPSNPNQRFRLTDAASPHESDPLPSGTYSVTEDISTGWALTSATCDNGNVPTDITVAPGITVTCTFTNTKLGSIEIVKDTVGGDGTFSYSGIGGLGNFSLTTNDGRASRTFNDLMPGSYSVTEANPAPTFDFTSLFCDDPGDDTTISDRTATIDLAAGETVTCTFINTKRGTIIIQKSASPSNTGLEFTFQRDFGSFNPNFTLAHDQSRTFSRPPGDYTISEIVPVGWVLSTSCSNGVNSNPATISLGPGQTVTCTFANSALATSIRARKTATPAIVEPGEKVEYRYEVRNTSVAPLPLTNIDLHDDKCSPISGPGGALNWNTTWVYTCTTTLAADTANTASVTAKDFLGRTVSDTDTAFVDVRPTVTISKTVTPATRPEPGGDFTFALTITNLSAERVRITELSDSYPLSAECLALKDKVLAVREATRCSYTVTRTQPGLYTNTATVKVREADRGHGLDTTDLEATASASASFTVVDIPSSLAVGKRAQPSVLPAPGGPVTFTLFVTNTSPVDSIILTTIAAGHNDDGVDDDTFSADAICLTTTLAPGDSTHCQFNHGVTGAAGEVITGKTTVQAIDDANIDVAAIATATIYLLEGAP
ncbi:MAG: hypothetical protein DCC55_34730, partial [Chloroflexi bacterium]